jgi:hypothetical protein
LLHDSITATKQPRFFTKVKRSKQNQAAMHACQYLLSTQDQNCPGWWLERVILEELLLGDLGTSSMSDL